MKEKGVAIFGVIITICMIIVLGLLIMVIIGQRTQGTDNPTIDAEYTKAHITSVLSGISIRREIQADNRETALKLINEKIKNKEYKIEANGEIMYKGMPIKVNNKKLIAEVDIDSEGIVWIDVVDQ